MEWMQVLSCPVERVWLRNTTAMLQLRQKTLCVLTGSRASLSVSRLLRSGLEQGQAKQGSDETRAAWQPGAKAAGVEPSEGARSSPPSSQASTVPPVLQDIARVLEGPLGLQPGKGCVVGEGLATVDLALFVEGRQVAVQLDSTPASAVPGSPVTDAKVYAENRTRQRVLQSFGWATASVSEQEWAAAGKDDHKKMHLAITAIKKALGMDGDGHHHHHAGCGCSH